MKLVGVSQEIQGSSININTNQEFLGKIDVSLDPLSVKSKKAQIKKRALINGHTKSITVKS